MNPEELEQLNLMRASDNEKVINLNFYRIKKNLKEEGFDLITNKNGTLTLVLRINR